MSDEPTPKDNGAEWSMPEPIFRSSEGHTPKRVMAKGDPDEVDTESPDADAADEVDTLTPDFFEADTEVPNASVIEAETVDVSELTTEAFNLNEEIPADDLPNEVSPDTPTDPSIQPGKSGGGCLKSMVTIISVIALFTVILMITAVYFLFYYGATDTTTF